MSFVVGNDDNPLFKGAHDTVLTFMEATADEIHDALSDVISGQTHYRLVSVDSICIDIVIQIFHCLILNLARGSRAAICWGVKWTRTLVVDKSNNFNCRHKHIPVAYSSKFL